MPPAGDEQRRHETPNPNNPILLSCSVVDSEEVLTEILLRLPAKSLIRFKSVSKRWLSLISSDYFCHQHTLRGPKPQPSLLLQHSGHWSDPDYFYLHPTTNGPKAMTPYTPSVDPHEILQACNGLLLLRNFDNYYVYNPTTKKSRRICLAKPSKSYFKIALAFDPSKSPYYKVVCIRHSSYKVEVYDSESHGWKVITYEPHTHIDTCDELVVYALYCNNAIVWGNDEEFAVDAYDIAKNELKTLPYLPYHGADDLYLQESDGRLYHLKLVSVEKGVLMEVWELGGDEDSKWLLKCNNLISPCEGDEYGGGKVIRLVSHSNGDGDGDEAMVLLSYLENGKIRAYNFLDKSSEDLVDFTAQPFDYSDDDDVDSDCGEFYDVKAFQFGEILALV